MTLRRLATSLVPELILLQLGLFVLVTLLTPLTPGGPSFGDLLTDVRRHFGTSAELLAGGALYRDVELEYPALAVLPMVVPRLLGGVTPETYGFLFVLQMGLVSTAIALLIAAVATRWRVWRRPSPRLVWYALAVLAALPTLAFHFDLLPAALTLGAVLAAAAGRPSLAGVSLGLGVAIKLYPAVVGPILGLAYLAKGDRRGALRMASAAAVTVGLALLPFVASAPGEAFSFLGYHTARGLEIESVPAGLFLLGRMLGLPVEAGSSAAFGSWQLVGPLPDALAAVQPIAFVVLYAGLCLVAYRRFRHDSMHQGSEWPVSLARLSLAAVLLFLVAGKVYSPQYVAWLIPFIPLLPRAEALATLAVVGLTSLIFPLNFGGLVAAQPFAVLLLNLRNGLSILLLGSLLAGQPWLRAPARSWLPPFRRWAVGQAEPPPSARPIDAGKLSWRDLAVPFPAVVVGLLAVGLLVRLLVMPAAGFPSDIDESLSWARRLREFGPWGFYEGGPRSVYPALLMLIWPLTVLPDDVLRVALKGLAIPFDLALGLLLILLVRARASQGHALLAAGLYLFNPGVIVSGPLWGQWDSVGSFFMLAALAALAAEKTPAAGVLAALAALAKPQFGLVAIIVLVVAAARAWDRRDPLPVLQAVAGGLVAAAAVLVPLRLTPLQWLGQVQALASTWPYTSLYAFNPWGLAFGFLQDDTGLVVWGAVLLVAGLALALLPLRWRRDLAALLAVGAFSILAFYFLPTRVHERYLFPVFALLAPFAAVRVRLLGPYLALSAGFGLALGYMLWVNRSATHVELPAWFSDTVYGWPGVVLIGILLMGAAVVIVVRLLVSEMWLEPSRGQRSGG